jgi:CRISPR-associated protein Cas1
MSRNYYIFNHGRLSRKDNTVFFLRYKSPEDKDLADFEECLDDFVPSESDGGSIEPDPDLRYEESGEKKVIPVEDIDSIYVFGETDFNRRFFNFCGSKHIPVHIFNYFGYYSGTYYPREFLNSGELLLRQVRTFDDAQRRLELARQFVQGSCGNIVKNLQYYNTRNKDTAPFLEEIEKLRPGIQASGSIPELMGIEGNIRQIYYASWTLLIDPPIEFSKRVKHPPDNMINALISFANSLVYTTCLSEIYRTQLNPLISYLHEPGTRRFSLSLDLAEIFKPLLSDRIIFTLLNKKQLTEKDFKMRGKICWLDEAGKKTLLREYDEKLSTTIKHRGLGRNVSYRRLIRLECYKLIKHLMEQEPYKPFQIWW